MFYILETSVDNTLMNTTTAISCIEEKGSTGRRGHRKSLEEEQQQRNRRNRRTKGQSDTRRDSSETNNRNRKQRHPSYSGGVQRSLHYKSMS